MVDVQHNGSGLVARTEDPDSEKDASQLFGVRIDNKTSKDEIKNMTWVTTGNHYKLMSSSVADRLESAVYNINVINNELVFSKRELMLDNLIEYENIENLISDFDRFWEKENLYIKYKMVHKRGILLYGPPGSGKTSIINMFIKKLLNKYDGVVIIAPPNIDLHQSALSTVRLKEPNRPIISVMEDVEDIFSKMEIPTLLNLLDGSASTNHIFHILTTNYIDRIDERLIGRPSRIDTIYEIDMPSNNMRRRYLESINTFNDIKDIDEWVKKTNGMSFAQIKELFISFVIYDKQIDDTICRLNKEKRLKKKDGYLEENVGFVHSKELK